MPVHSVDWDSHRWDFRRYAEEIASIRHRFRAIVACVHPACWEKGYWVREFHGVGIPTIKGAYPTDFNSHPFLADLFSCAEYVTTNGFGSHWTYASYYGAKLSVFGTFAEYKKEGALRDPFWLKHPELIDVAIETQTEGFLKEHYPQFFCSPWEAQENTEWAQEQLGEAQRQPPRRLRALLGWRPQDRLRRAVTDWARAAAPRSLKHAFKVRVQTDYRELSRLRRAPAHTQVSTNLLGAPFLLDHVPAFLTQYDRFILNKALNFGTCAPQPLVIDGSAGVGLGIVAIKQQHPGSRVLAFEPDLERYGMLVKNCASLGFEDVSCQQNVLGIPNGAPWEFANERDRLPGHTAAGSGEVATVTLADLLHEKVDLLKLELSDCSHVDGFLASRAFLANVDHLFLRIITKHHQPQKLAQLLTLLEDCGYRVEIQNGQPASRPFMLRGVGIGREMELYLFAWRAS
jgi:hypothetical protein